MARKKADDIRAMRLLIDSMGAEIALDHRPAPPRSKVQRVADQLAVEDHVIDWHTRRQGSMLGCTLNRGTTADADGVQEHDPLMPRWASLDLPRESRVVVLGPAPSHEDAIRGEVGWAKPDRLLGQHLRRAGIDDSQITWLHCVWCWPDGGAQSALSTRGRSRGRYVRMSRPPTAGELGEWHAPLMAALDAADVTYVLLHGLQAVNAWRPDLGIGQLIGDQYMWNDRWLVTPLHHATALKHLKDTDAIRQWEQGVEKFAYRVQNGAMFGDFPKRCVFCKERFYTCDQDGVGVCDKHMADIFKKAADARHKSKKLINEHDQEGML